MVYLLVPKRKSPTQGLLVMVAGYCTVIPAGGIMDRLGNFKAPPHKIWEWRLDNDDTRLLHIIGEVMDVYKPSQVGRYATV